MPHYMTRGFILRVIREALGLTQRQAARWQAVDPSWLSRIETGRLALSDQGAYALLQRYDAGPVLRRLRDAIDATLAWSGSPLRPA